jgi:hypothetical protein
LNEWKQGRSERVHGRKVGRKTEMNGGRRARSAFCSFVSENTNPSLHRTPNFIRYQLVIVSAHQYAVPVVDEPSSVWLYQYIYHGPC